MGKEKCRKPFLKEIKGGESMGMCLGNVLPKASVIASRKDVA
jgi:hypothetical protein